MLYVITGTDNENSLDKRLNARAAHLERLKILQDQGRLIMAGPFPAIDSVDPGSAGFTGSLIVAEFDSLEKAKLWADSDPYVEAGVYHSVSVKPFKHVLP
ncbi:MAG: YciI family protein [Thioalkalispiraceae bacterium]